MKAVFILAIGLLCISIYGQDDQWGDDGTYVYGVGRSVDKETAFRQACQDALKTALEEKISRADFERYREIIVKMIATSYRKYYSGKPETVSWKSNKIKIKGKAKLEKLMADLKYRVKPKVVKGKIGILKWDSKLQNVPDEYSPRIRAITESVFESVLHKYGLKFTTMEALAEQHRQEMNESEDYASMEDLIFQRSTLSQYIIILAVNLHWKRVLDPIDKSYRYYWDAKISAEVMIARKAQRFFKCFYPLPGEHYGVVRVVDNSQKQDKAEQAVRKVSEKVAMAIVKKIRSHHDEIALNIYTAYFSKFSRRQLLQIKKALDILEDNKVISELEISGGAKLKAVMRSRIKFSHLQEKISTATGDMGVRLSLDPLRISSASQVCYFIPSDEMDD